MQNGKDLRGKLDWNAREPKRNGTVIKRDELPVCIVGEENFNNLRYADDTALLAESESTLQGIVDVVRQNSEEKGLRMNVKRRRHWWYITMKHQM